MRFDFAKILREPDPTKPSRFILMVPQSVGKSICMGLLVQALLEKARVEPNNEEKPDAV
jgi:hypothetical protein